MPFQGFTLPAPSGGLNLVDAIDNLPPNDADELINLYPNGSKVSLRGGHREFCDTGSSAIRSMYVLPLANGTRKILVGTNATFQEVSSGAASAVTGATTPTSNDWNATVFSHRLFLCNGADTVQVYTGSGNCADSTFTGVTLSTLINVSSYKERLYFVKKDSASFWYGPTKSIAGALTEFDLQYYFTLGGRLLFAGSYTDRLSSVAQDLFMACSSEGELFFYSGSYPGGAWELAAKFKIGRPLGYRAFIRVDNDIWIITEQGIVPVSLLFSGSPTVALNTVGRKVNKRIADFAANTGSSHLWHGLHWSIGRRVFIVVPASAVDTILLVCNTETGAWCEYRYATSGTAISIAEADGIPYLGDNVGVVHQAEQNFSDGGVAIAYEGRLAYSFFGSRGNFKKFVDVRPLIVAGSTVTIGVGIDTDFQRGANLDTISGGVGNFTAWGSDWGSDWSGDVSYLFNRYSLRGQGHSGAIRISGSVLDAPLEFNAFEVRFEIGGQV